MGLDYSLFEDVASFLEVRLSISSSSLIQEVSPIWISAMCIPNDI